MRTDGSASCRPRLVSGLALASLFLVPPLHAEDIAAMAVGSEPAPVTLVRPTDKASVPGGRHGTKVGLAWQRSHGSPIWYFVEVLESDPRAMREVFTGYTRQTALRVRLDGAGAYAWRVVAVNRASAHYSVTPWRSFTVKGVPEETR